MLLLASQLRIRLPLPFPSAQVLLNKVALSSFDFGSPNALLFYQCALCVLLVHICRLAGLVKVEPFNWQIIKVGRQTLPHSGVHAACARHLLCRLTGSPCS